MPAWVLVAFLLGSQDDRRPTAVSFSATEGCPPRERFEQELVFRTKKVRLVAPEEATATLDVSLTSVGKRFFGRLLVRTADGKTVEKSLQGPRSETVTAALSLAAALLLDPEASLAPVPETLPPVEPPPAPLTVEAKPDPAPEAPPPAAPPPAVIAPSPSPPPGNGQQRVAGAVFAQGLLSSSVSGQVDGGGGLGGELELGSAAGWGVVSRLTASVCSGRTVASTAGSASWPLAGVGTLGVGASWRFGWLRPELGATAQLSTLGITGLGADQNLASQRWLLAIGPHAALSASFFGWRLGVLGVAAFPLNREQYEIDPDGLVFQVPSVAAVGQLFFGRAFE